MAAVNADVLAVLATCGLNPADSQRVIDGEGFDNLEDFGILESDNDVNEMAKCLASRPLAQRVFLGVLAIKHLQPLVWWVHDLLKCNQPLVAADFDNNTITAVLERKKIQKAVSKKDDVAVKDLEKFDPNDYDLHELAFLNLLAQCHSADGETLRYVVHPAAVPAAFASEEEERMFQLPLHGPSFDDDNHNVFRKLKAFLVNTPGWAWIKEFDATENGRGAFLAWSNHYNGEGELSKRTAAAKAKLKDLHYKNERSMSFERVISIMKSCFATLDKDEDERVSERQQVEKLLRSIQSQESELAGAKAVIRDNYRNNFTAACNYFAAVVSEVHGAAIQEYSRSSRKRGIFATQRGGGGRARFGGRGRDGQRGRGGRGGRYGRGGRGGRDSNDRVVINGVDVSDPTRNFTQDEWNPLGPTQNYVIQRHMEIHGRGNRYQGQHARGGGRDGQRNIGAMGQAGDETGGASGGNDQQHGNGGRQGERGGRNGRGFGRGAYGSGGHS